MPHYEQRPELVGVAVRPVAAELALRAPVVTVAGPRLTSDPPPWQPKVLKALICLPHTLKKERPLLAAVAREWVARHWLKCGRASWVCRTKGLSYAALQYHYVFREPKLKAV